MKPTLLTLIALWAFAFTGLAQQTITDGRLSVTYWYEIERDSLDCWGKPNYFYTVTVINSTSADTVKKHVYPSFQFISRYVNTAGNPTFNFNANNTSVLYYDLLAINDTMHMVFVPRAFTCGPDTVIIPGDTLSQYWPNPCVYDTLLNYMYIDTQGTCPGNQGNPPVNGITAEIYDTVYNGKVVSASWGTGSAGAWLYLIQRTYRTAGCGVYLPKVLQFLYPNSDPGCITPYFWFDSLPNHRYILKHGFKAERKVDVSVWLGSAGIIRPQVPFLLFPEVFNLGYKAVSGQVYLVLDPRVSYNPALSNNAPVSISGDTLMWNFNQVSNATNGGWWNAFQTFLYLTPGSQLNIGDTLCFEIFTGHVPDDINPANNYLRVCYPLVNSYDPNIKEVSPAGQGPTGIVPMSTDELTYTVHFQNTGNAPAIDVVVLDTLDSNIDLSSFTLLGSTHRLDPEWAGNGIFRARFNNINLPDSTSNEPKSHGSFSYKVKLKAGLAMGTQIKNSAAIYFDNNAPIITNTTVNTLQDNLIGFEMITTRNGVTVYPNPTNSTVNIVTETALNNGTLKLLNLNGQVLQQQTHAHGTYFTFNVEALAAGVYFVEVTTPANVQRIKLVKE